jgi:hypothetical protein
LSDPTAPIDAPDSLVQNGEDTALVTEAELTTLQLALSFEMPAMIPPTGYHHGHIRGQELFCADEAGVFLPDEYGSLDYEHSADARGGLVAVADGQLQRREFDWETGALSAPFTAPTGTGEDDDHQVSALWHHDVDVALVDEQTPVLRNLQNRSLVTFAAGSQAKQWFDSGRALLMTELQRCGASAIGRRYVAYLSRPVRTGQGGTGGSKRR